MSNKSNAMTAIFLSLLITAGSLFAVTDQQVQQMREAMPDSPVVQPEKTRTVLVFSLCKGFKHDCIPYWAAALDIMSEKTGAFSVVHSTDMSVFTPDSLSRFDVICFNNTTKLEPTTEQQTAIMDFITAGKGIVGIHAATDNFYNWPQGAIMMGGLFKGHPWTAGGTWAIKIDDPDHPLTKPFAGKGFTVNDEIYRTAPPEYSREHQRVLMSLDMSDPATAGAEGVTPDDRDTGISWIKPVGKGRLFYCSLGHNAHLTWNTAVLGHYLAGIQYAAGDLKADDRPIAVSSSLNDKLVSLFDQLRNYDWDSSRAVPIEIEHTIRTLDENTAARIDVERMLLDVLKANTSLAAKDFVCRQLAVIGTEVSVPALSDLLANPETTSMARYALENIPGEAVEERLTAVAAKTENDTILIGILTTLGTRQSSRVMELGKTLLADKSEAGEDVRTAVIWALGSVGTEKSADLLREKAPALQGHLRQRCLDALLKCADHLDETGHETQAKEIYQTLYRADMPSVTRGAAFMGLARLDDVDAELLTEAVTGTDEIVQAAAIRSLAHVKDGTMISSVMSAAGRLSDIGQIRLLTALSETAPEKGRLLAKKLADSQQAAVRIAAYRALEKTGDVSAIDILAAAAAKAEGRDERTEARQALYRLSGERIDAAILHKIAQSQKNGPADAVAVELINAAAERGIENAVAVLKKTALSDNGRISAASVQAIQSLAEARHAPDLVELVIAKPTSNTENALIVLGEKMPEPEQLASMLKDQYAALGDNVDAKASLLRVMGKLGSPGTVELIKREYASSNETLRQAAFRAMTDWPKADFVDMMKELSRSADDPKTRILAYRAYIRMLQDTGGSGQDTVDALIAAYAMAPRADEKKMVIGALAEYPGASALAFVRERLTDPDLKAEAQASLLKMSEKLIKSDPGLVKPVLKTLKESGISQSVRDKADELLGKLNSR